MPAALAAAAALFAAAGGEPSPCDAPAPTTYSVEVRVYSGTPNPRAAVPAATAAAACALLANDSGAAAPCRVLGYTGVVLRGGGREMRVSGGGAAEALLLAAVPLPADVRAHAEEVAATAAARRCPPPPGDDDAAALSAATAKCTSVPIVGPDTPPSYGPSTDDGGCFKKEQSKNNCYDYGNDIVTNTFAQPGRGGGEKWKQNTCGSVRHAAERDGLVWLGTDLPAVPKSGHNVALFIWPKTNFHWIRQDTTGMWSHKPGGSPVKNVDNNNKEISDPSKSSFSPWTQFCGYMHTLPSNVTIN